MEWIRRLRLLFRRERLERDLEEEMRIHVEMAAGEMGDEAAARRAFGNPLLLRERSADVWGWRWVREAAQDARFGLRMLGKNRGFTAVAVLTLALGIGACTGVLSVVNAVLFRPLPYPHSERLVVLIAKWRTADGRTIEFGAQPADFLDWRGHSRSLDQISSARTAACLFTIDGEPRRCKGAAASFDFFQLLGIDPVRGRTFTPEEDQPGHDTVALLDAGFWRQELGADPSVLGRFIELNGKSYTVVGILPAGRQFADFGQVDVWVPLAAAPVGTFKNLAVVGRLRAGVTVQAAQAEMDSVTRSLDPMRRQKKWPTPTGVALRPLRSWVIGDIRIAFLLVLGAAGCVLLICCANIATLLMARATSRRAEIALRRCLGAGRFRLLRQMLAESILLAAIGGALGLTLAVSIVRVVPSIKALSIPRVEEIGLDWRTFAIAALLSIGAGILFGVAPIFEIGRANPGSALRSGGFPVRGRSGSHGLRSTLVVAQVALSLVLLSGAGLLLNSYFRLLRIDLGFQPERLLALSVPFLRNDLGQQLVERVEHMPGVQGASSCSAPPLQAVHFTLRLRVEGRDMREPPEAEARFVGVRYCKVAGIAVRKGREFVRADDTLRPVPGLINETAARQLFPGENPIGKRLLTGYRDFQPLEVVGVVADTRQLGLREEPGLQVYVPVSHNFASHVIVRTSGDIRPLAQAIRAASRELAPDAPAPEIRWMEESLDEQVALPRFYLGLFGAFAIAGLLLAAVGTYGVMSYSVTARTHDIGVRMALGAERAEILRTVVGKGLLLTGLGTVLGFAGAFALTSFLEKLLYGVRPHDPVTLICAALLLGTVALVACYIPARRATEIEPTEAIRYE
jgi:putative ABC transport system permease protein